MNGLAAAVERVVRARASTPEANATLVALSGIDGSGKGYAAARLVEELGAQRVGAVVLHVDGFLDLPFRRFDPANPAEHFYRHAIRFDELFDQLVLPLRRDRAVRVVVDHAEEIATSFARRLYRMRDVDVIVLEGIFLLERELCAHYDLRLWLDCSFETALERAVRRAQEGLPVEETIRAYQTIYFPAQRIHLGRDDPRGTADWIWVNDPRLPQDT